MTNETIMKKIAELRKKATRSREDAELKKARLAEDFALKQRRLDEDEEIKQRRIAEDIAELESALDDMPEVVTEEAEAPVVPEPTMEEPVAEENVKVVTEKSASKIDRILAKAREYQLRKHEELAQEFCKLQEKAYDEDQWIAVEDAREYSTEDLEDAVADAKKAIAEIEKENRQTRQGERSFDRIIAQRHTVAVEKCKKAIAA